MLICHAEHLSRHLAVHNLNPGSLSDNIAEKLELTSSRPCYILLRYCRRCIFAFRLSAVRAPSTVKLGRMHSATPSWGVKLQPSDRAANYSTAFHSTLPLFGYVALAPKRKSNPSWHNLKQSAAKLPAHLIHFISTLLAATCRIPCCSQPALRPARSN